MFAFILFFLSFVIFFLVLSEQIEELEQYGRRTSLRFHNVPMRDIDKQRTDNIIVDIDKQRTDNIIVDIDKQRTDNIIVDIDKQRTDNIIVDIDKQVLCLSMYF
jgi:hypothetical protein